MPPVTPQLFLSTKNSASDGKKESQLILYRALERWSSQLTSQAGGGGTYASLTGPGETTTPGDLTQAGGFTVNSLGSTGITLNTGAAGTGGITLEGRSGIEMDDTSSAGIAISEGGSGGMQIINNGTGYITVNDNSPVASGGTFISLNLSSAHNTVQVAGYQVSIGTAILLLPSIPTTNPGGTNIVWRNGNVLNIT